MANGARLHHNFINNQKHGASLKTCPVFLLFGFNERGKHDMANKYKAEIEVTINGENKIMKYDLNALVEIQEKLELEQMQDILKKLENMDFKTMRLVLWAGFIHNHMDDNGNITLTLKDVGGWQYNLQDVATKMGEAIKLGLGIDEDINPKNVIAPKKTGKTK